MNFILDRVLEAERMVTSRAIRAVVKSIDGVEAASNTAHTRKKPHYLGEGSGCKVVG